MFSLLRRRVLSEMAARRSVWAVGAVLAAACTTLVLKALPEFGLAASFGLISGVALAWVVLGSQLPRVIRG